MSLTIELPKEVEAELRRRAEAEGLSVEECAQDLLRRGLDSASPRDPNLGGVVATILQRMRKVQPAEFEGMPEDGASRHDHYIYGTPKKQMG